MGEIILFSTVSVFGILVFGFLLGLKHATEADHLAAVGTIVSEQKSIWGSAFVGGLWGLGHTISLLLAGIFVLLLNFQISEKTSTFLEFGVGVMLLLLGLNVFRKIAQGGKIHFHTHEHGDREHTHPHLHEPESQDSPDTHHGFKFSPRSIIIGMIHGLAGSSAMMLLYLPTIESNNLKLIYIIIFGVGSIGGMVLMSLLVGLPFHFTASRFNQYNRILQGIAGLISIFFGLQLMYEQGIEGGLFG